MHVQLNFTTFPNKQINRSLPIMGTNRVVQPTIDIIVDNKNMTQRLLKLSLKTGYNIVQKNGQRFYGPAPNWTGPPPIRGSEVFIGRLPRDCFEDELVPLLETIGPIYDMRMMLNFTGYNRGYAFVTYCNATTAWQAVERLNNFEIRPDRKIGVWKSWDNCRLYIGGIPFNVTKLDAWEEVVKFCPTVKDIIMYTNPLDRKKNRGFMFLEFESHRAAAMAKRSFPPGTVKMWNQPVLMDWATLEPDINPQVMANIRKLFFRNFPSTFNEESIKRILHHVIPCASIERIYITAHYGFAHFDTRAHAELAEEILSRICLDGELLEVQWARPKCYRRSIRYAPHYRSIPARYQQRRQRKIILPIAPPAPEVVLPSPAHIVPVYHQLVPVSQQRTYPLNVQPINPVQVIFYK